MAIPGLDTIAQITGSSTNPDGKAAPIFSDADYKPVLSNWYTAKPYGFKFTPKSGSPMVMFLPINPSNLSVTTHFATSVLPTLYGTIEEHSPVRYYDITIEGTTGMGPRYVAPIMWPGSPEKKTMRSRFTVQQTIRAEGFFANTIATAQNVYNETAALFGKTPEVATGLQLDQTGYIAFHNLYRFLLKYKKDASGADANSGVKRVDGSHPLSFFNYKDNTEYKVAIRSMTLRRDKEDPMMYHYHISMRGYDLSSVEGGDKPATSETADLLSSLGLSGIDNSEFLSDAKKKAADAKAVLGSVANGLNQLGR